MNLSFAPVLSLSLESLAEHLHCAFQNYIVPIHFTPEVVAGMIRAEAIDLSACRLILREEETVGIALIARRGKRSRLAAFALAPEARRQGVGRKAMELLLEEARQRGEQEMVLEVVEQNTAGVRLYEGLGFRKERRLVGYTANGGAAAVNTELTEISISEVACALMTGQENLPWQISAETLGQGCLPARAYRLGAACTVISSPEAPQIGLRALYVSPEARRQGEATRLVRALMGQFPEKVWKFPILIPETIPSLFFTRLGFVREELSQWEMRREL
jgi:ribosomal protein S18 acetylase RimI-like enzyme